MDITSLYNVASEAVRTAADSSKQTEKSDGNMFDAVLNSALDNLRTTNSYIADADTEKMRLAMGEVDNTHELTIAMQKASTAMTYTIAVRDKFMEAYKEIMQMQI